MPSPAEERDEEATPSQGSSDDPLRYATPYHIPVLCNVAISGLVTDPHGVYVDATLGGGGHSAALLEALAPDAQVLGIDRDEEALAAARKRLADQIESDRFHVLHGSFGDLERLLRTVGVTVIDGLLVDLGVSSHQLDVPERGFSYTAEGALDMRMDPRGGLTADEVVNRWPEADLRQVLYTYGEEKRGRKIARAIVQARPLQTTTALAAVVRSVVPHREEVKSLARVFQAIRIAVNGELEELERVLEAGVRLLKPGGRMAVLSYQSLEDRRVKRFFRYGNLRGEPERDLYGHSLSPWREITRKPVQATAAEVAANPRARSARLRIAERRPDP